MPKRSGQVTGHPSLVIFYDRMKKTFVALAYDNLVSQSFPESALRLGSGRVARFGFARLAKTDFGLGSTAPRV